MAVFDRSSGTLRTLPVAHDTVLRLEPRVHGVEYGPSSEGALSPGEEIEAEERKAAALRLVEQLGSQRRRRQLLAREAARVDPTQTVSSAEALRGQVASGGSGVGTQEELVAQAMAARPLPPHDPQATTADEAYKIRGGLIWDAIWDTLPAQQLVDAVMSEKVDQLKKDNIVQTAYVAARLSDAHREWKSKKNKSVSPLECARLLALLDAILILVMRWPTLRGAFGPGRDSLSAKVGIPTHILAPMLARFYTHHPADAQGPERWTLPTSARELALNWAAMAALRAESGSVLENIQLAELAEAMQVKPATLLDRFRELGASVTGAKGRATRVVLLPHSVKPRTLASYFPELRTQRKRGRQ